MRKSAVNVQQEPGGMSRIGIMYRESKHRLYVSRYPLSLSRRSKGAQCFQYENWIWMRWRDIEMSEPGVVRSTSRVDAKLLSAADARSVLTI